MRYAIDWFVLDLHSPYNLRCMHFKCTIHCICSVVKIYAASTTVNFRTFSSPQSSHSTFPPSPKQLLLIYFLSLQVKLFWALHINGVIQYIVFCGWLLSLGLIFSRFIHIVVRTSTWFFFMAKKNPIVCIWHISFVHSSVDVHLCCFHFLSTNE